MFAVGFVFMLMSAVSSSKVLIRLTNDSIPTPVAKDDDTLTTPVNRRRSTLKQWILRTEQSNVFSNDKVDAVERYMSMSLTLLPSPAPPSSQPARTFESSPFHPSSYPSIEVVPGVPQSCSNAPSEINRVPNFSSSAPSHSPPSTVPLTTKQPNKGNFSVSEIPTASTKHPTEGNFSVSETPTVNKSPFVVATMYPANIIPTKPVTQNVTISNPVQSSMPSNLLSHQPSATPTSSIVSDGAIFECRFDNIIGKTNRNVLSTTLSFKVGYSVESSANQSEYIIDVENQILLTAVAGALQCENSGVFFTDFFPDNNGDSRITLGVVTNTTRSTEMCLLTNISECHIFETSFHVDVGRDLDPEVAEFLGYVLIRDKMEDGTFSETVHIVDRCEYLRPLPLLPPANVDDGVQQEVSNESERLSVSPWSLATLSLLCEFFKAATPWKDVFIAFTSSHITGTHLHIGACCVIAIAALYRKRAQRNHSHMELAED